MIVYAFSTPQKMFWSRHDIVQHCTIDLGRSLTKIQCYIALNKSLVTMRFELYLCFNILAIVYTIKIDTFISQCLDRPPLEDLSYRYKEVYVKNQTRCFAECQREDKCSAATFDKTTGRCSLFPDIERPCSSGPFSGLTDEMKYIEKVIYLIHIFHFTFYSYNSYIPYIFNRPMVWKLLA